MSRALVVVDYQNDFASPDGALSVSGGDAIAGRINELMRSGDYDLVVATRDWHPPDHGSFTEQGGIWPVHCVQDTDGRPAAPRPRRGRRRRDRRQGPGPAARRATRASTARGSAELLRERGIDQVTVVGLATDYCVKQTALEALQEGFAVTVDTTAVRGVDVEPGDSDRALAELRAAGAVHGVMPCARPPTGSSRSCAARIADERVLSAIRAVPRDLLRPGGRCARRRGTTSRCRSAAARRSPSRSSSRACASCSSSTATSACSTSARAPATTRRCWRGWPPRSTRSSCTPSSPTAPRGRWRAAGADVTLAVGDGCRGLPEHAPYDAINVAAAARRPRARPRSWPSSRRAAGSSRRSRRAATSGSRCCARTAAELRDHAARARALRAAGRRP